MKLITAIIEPYKLPDVKQSLYDAHVYKMTITNALGCGKDTMRKRVYRGVEQEIFLTEKLRLEVAVEEDFVEPTIEAIIRGARTEGVLTGQGKIYIVDLKRNISLSNVYSVSTKNLSDQELKDIVDNSYWRITGVQIDNKGFFDSFYDHFMVSSAEIRAKFKNTDMVFQKFVLWQSFDTMMNFHMEKNSESIEELAIAHSKKAKDIPPFMYDLWLDSLIATVRLFDAKCTSEIEEAWRKVLSAGITFMISKYDLQ
jgi:nitrogen regulatory protein P-II 2